MSSLALICPTWVPRGGPFAFGGRADFCSRLHPPASGTTAYPQPNPAAAASLCRGDYPVPPASHRAEFLCLSG